MARKTVEDLMNLVRPVRDRSFSYEKRDPERRKWSHYDNAKVNETADVIETIRDIVDMAASSLPEKKTAGKPPVPASYVVNVMLMQTYIGMPNRIAEGFFRLFGEKLGITSFFSYKTIERGYDPERTKQLLDEIHRIMNIFGNSKERLFSTDGTGDPTTMKVNYESKRNMQNLEREKHKHNKEKSDEFPSTRGKYDFQYSSFAAGVRRKMYAGFSTTDDHSIGELSHFPSIMSHIMDLAPGIEEMLGDALYSNRNVCSITLRYGIDQCFFPKTNASFRARSAPSWKTMLYAFMDDTQ